MTLAHNRLIRQQRSVESPLNAYPGSVRRRYLGNEQRDAEIVRLLRAGVLQRETAWRVDVSVGTVRYIKRRDMPNEGARHG